MDREINDTFINEALDNNVFGRNKKAINIINHIAKSDKQEWIAINGPWGSGKSVFVKEIEYLINNKEKYKQICREVRIEPENIQYLDIFYYNSWENDAIKNPVLSLLFQIINKYDLSIISDAEERKMIFDILKKLASQISFHGIKIDFENISFESYLEECITAEDIRNNFNLIIDKVLAEKNNRLVIIIDELDRCRPTFAVELLETIKHFYLNDKITFIFATNINQLSNTVKKVYGNDYDGELYLFRFFSKVYDFTRYSKDKFIATYLDFDLRENHIAQLTAEVCINYFNFSIRQITQFVNSIKYHNEFITFRGIMFDAKFHFMSRNVLFIIGLATKFVSREQFKKFIKGEFEIERFVNSNKRYYGWIADVCIHETDDKERNIEYLKTLYLNMFSHEDLSKYDEKEEAMRIMNELDE